MLSFKPEFCLESSQSRPGAVMCRELKPYSLGEGTEGDVGLDVIAEIAERSEYGLLKERRGWSKFCAFQVTFEFFP